MAAAGSSGWPSTVEEQDGRRWRLGGEWDAAPEKKDSADGRQDEDALGPVRLLSLWLSVCRGLLSLWAVMDAMRWTRTGEREKLRLQASPGVAKSAQGTFFFLVQQQQHQHQRQRQRQRLATTCNHAVSCVYWDRPAFIVGFTG